MTGGVHYAPGTGLSRAGLAGVVLGHLLVLFALLQLQVIPLPAPLHVLQVSLLPGPEEPLPQVAPTPPQPPPVVRQERPQPTLLTSAPLAEVPSAVTAPVTVPPAPSFAETPAEATPPRFDADYLDNPKPVYPALSRRMGEQGKVLLRVRVDAAGRASEVLVHSGSGAERLDQAALAAVRRWKFVPARLGDVPVAATVLVPIVFSLKD